ncbi:MAG: hypothetical protein AB1458_14340 [Bacteroidota bacterium]
MKTLALIASLVLLWGASSAQSKKKIKMYKIKSTTETTTETIEGKEVTYKSVHSVFDKEGETTEKTEYRPDGSVKRKETKKFDGKGNVLEETFYEVKDNKGGTDKPGVKNTKKTYKYNSNDDVTEECEYDGAKLLKKTVTSYNSNGDKSMEVTYDADGKLLKKSVFAYDKKGLKIEKKTYDANNNVIEVKKYTYQF